MTMPELPPLPDAPKRFKLGELPDADLVAFGITWAAAAAMDLVARQAISVAIALADAHLTLFPALVERLIEHVNAAEAERLALKTALVKTGVLSAEDVKVIQAVTAEIGAQRAVDRAFDPRVDESVAALRAWLARLEEVNR